jgi:putative oxidoreductase
LPRIFSALMIIFVAGTIYYFHDFWNQTPPDNAKTLIDALKNLSIIGALFMVFGYGRGPRRAAEQTAYGDI